VALFFSGGTNMNHPIRLLALAVATIGLTGCDGVSFLFPLAENAADVVTDVDLSGKFRDPEGDQWLFEKQEDGRYQLTWSDKKETVHLDATLVRISNHLFLDVSSKDEFTSIRGHHFAKVRLDGDVLEVSWLDGGWLKKKLSTEKPLAYERPCTRGEKDCRYVVTADTRQLQSFVMRHAMDEAAFGKPDRLRR